MQKSCIRSKKSCIRSKEMETMKMESMLAALAAFFAANAADLEMHRNDEWRSVPVDSVRLGFRELSRHGTAVCVFAKLPNEVLPNCRTVLRQTTEWYFAKLPNGYCCATDIMLKYPGNDRRL